MQGMNELRAPDPTLLALGDQDVLVDWTAPHNTHLPVAHLEEHEGVHLFEPLIADISCWFATPCRTCFPDAPPPGWDHIDNVPPERRAHRSADLVGDLALAWQTGV